jgi:hypothetical protein
VVQDVLHHVKVLLHGVKCTHLATGGKGLSPKTQAV